MRMPKRTGAALALALALAAAFVAVSAAEDSDAASSGTCGENLTWDLNDSGNLTISGQGEMDHYSTHGPDIAYAPWGEDVKSVTIEEGVTSIGSFAFYRCTNLSSVITPHSVTSIGVGAFCECKSISSVTITGPVRAIGDSLFSGCTNLQYVFLPDSVEYIGLFAFFNCKNLKYINMPASLEEVDEYAFGFIPESQEYEYDYEFGELYFDSMSPGYAYAGAGNGYLYRQNYTLEYSVSADGKEAAVTGFRGTADKVTILPIYYGYRITAIAERAFYGCEDLKSVSMPSSVKTVGNYAFYKCTSLESVGLGSVESVGLKSFSYCQSLKSIIFPTTLGKIGGYAFYGSGLESLMVPGNTTVGKGAFSECGDLETVSFTGQGSRVGTRAFYNDGGLSSLDLAGAASVGVKAFSYCHGLSSVVIPGGVAAVEGYAFFGCANLKEVTVKEGVTKIGRSAFSGCRSLEMADLPETLEYIGQNAFCGKRFLDLDGNVMEPTLDLCGHTYFGSGKVLRMAGDIEDGERFSAGGIEYSVSSAGSREVAVTGYEEGASSVPGLVTYKGWPLKVTAVAAKALYGCSTLRSADLTNVRTIGMKAFAYCYSLEEASFGADLRSVGAYAFFGLSLYYGSIELQPDPVMLAGRSFAGADGALFIAEDASPYVVMSGSCGEDVRFCLDSRGNLMITGTGPMYDYSWASYTKTCTSWAGENTHTVGSHTVEVTYWKSTAPWFANLAPDGSFTQYAYGFVDLGTFNANPIRNIAIGEGVTTVGEHAFRDDCRSSFSSGDNMSEPYYSSIESVSLPDTVISIGANAFRECPSISSINIPGSVKTIGDKAFYGRDYDINFFGLNFFDEEGNRLSHDAESLAGYSYEGHNGKLYRISS